MANMSVGLDFRSAAKVLSAKVLNLMKLLLTLKKTMHSVPRVLSVNVV